jgi:hypothetical protein
MSKLLLAAVLGAATVATPAAAADWYMVSTAEDGTSVTFVDRDSIRASGGQLRQAQIFVVFSEPEDGTAALDTHREFDCAQPRSRFLYLVSFDEAMRRRSGGAGSGNWRDVNRGTQDEETRTFVCSGGALPANVPSYGDGYPFAAGRARMQAQAQPGK